MTIAEVRHSNRLTSLNPYKQEQELNNHIDRKATHLLVSIHTNNNNNNIAIADGRQ